MLLNCGVGEDSWESLGLARRSNQSILKEISPGCSLEGMMLKLKLQYFGHLMWRVDSLEKTLMLGGIGGRRRRGWDGWMASPTRWTWVWVNSRSWWWTGRPGVLRFMGLQRIGHDWETELNWIYFFFLGMVLIPASCTMSQTSVHSSSGTLSDLVPWVYLSHPLYKDKGFYLGHTWMV